ncbi:MAG: PAS domain-containing protein [Opitutaceae bacterium]|nr:PAS domain-containing protein [Opitutaceae bacterium]
MGKKKKLLIWQIYPSYLIIALFSIAAVGWFSSEMFRDFHYKHTESELKSAAYMAVDRLQTVSESEIDGVCKSLGASSGYRFTVVFPSGKVVGDSETNPEKMDDHGNRPEFQQALNGYVSVKKRFSKTVQMDLLYVAVPFIKDTKNAGSVRASLSLAQIDESLETMWRRLFWLGLVVACIAALATMLVARKISQPLDRIRKVAESFGQGHLQQEMPSSDVVEIDVLADAMGKMATQLNERIHTVTRQRDEQSALFSCMVEAVLAVDPEKRIIKLNKTAETLFQVDGAASIGRDVAEVIRNADILAVIETALETTDVVEGEIFLSQNDRYLQTHGTVLHGENESRIGALIVLNDITSLRKMEMMRRDFVANVSHELKTPITSIRGFVDTLIDRPVEEKEDQQRFIEIIRKQTIRLQAIVDDLMVLSNLEHEAGKNEIEFQNGQIDDLLENAVNICRDIADAKNISLEISCAPGMHWEINMPLLEQAIVNLIDNAVKYSEPGTHVEISAIQAEKEIVIDVCDEGPGIPKEHLSRLFERFYRVDKSRSHKLGGTGLGLAIVKHIAIAHGGHVTVDSQMGGGCRFSIHLPLIWR